MGRWLADYLRKRGEQVIIYDNNTRHARRIAKAISVIYSPTLDNAISEAKTIILSTPITAIPNLLETIAEKTPRQKKITILEISSIKTEAVKKARQITENRKNIRVVSIHPLFGPGVVDLSRHTIVVVPVRDRGYEVRFTRMLFPEPEIYVMDFRVHDRIVAETLSMMRLITLAVLNMWKPHLRRPKTTSQRLFLLAASSIINESPALFSQIVKTNPYSEKAVEKFIKKMKELNHLSVKALEKEYSKIKKEYSFLVKDYRKAHELLERLKM